MGHPLLENKMNESKLGLEEEVRQGAGREGEKVAYGVAGWSCQDPPARPRR